MHKEEEEEDIENHKPGSGGSWSPLSLTHSPLVLLSCLGQFLARPVRLDRPPSEPGHGAEAADDAAGAVASERERESRSQTLDVGYNFYFKKKIDGASYLAIE